VCLAFPPSFPTVKYYIFPFYKGNVDCFKLLIDSGASVSCFDQWGRTPLQTALAHDNKSILGFAKSTYLLPDKSEPIYESPSSLSLVQHSIDLRFELELAVASRRKESSDSASLEFPGDAVLNLKHLEISQQRVATYSEHKKRTPLSKLIEFPGDIDRLKDLLSKVDEIDINGKDMYGWAAVHKFASWDKIDSLQELIRIMPDPQDLNIRGGPDDFTCLHSAVDSGAFRSIRFLLGQSAMDEAQRDKRNRTPQDLAEMNNMAEEYRAALELADGFT